MNAESESRPQLSKEEVYAREDAARERHEQKRRHRILGSFLSFYLWLPLPIKIVFLILGLLYSPAMVQNLAACIRAEKTGRLRAISGPEFIYFYMVGIWGLIFSVLAHYQVTFLPLSWLYLSLILFTVVTVGLDFKGGSWLGVLVFLFGLVAVVGWYGDRHDIPILESIGAGIKWLDVEQFPTRFVTVMSSAILLVYTIVYIRMNLVHVLMIQGNYVQVWTLASRSPKDTRASFSLVPDFDDINEALLGFACRLNLRSKSRRVQSHEFPNMPGGPVVEQIATHLLNAQEVEVMDNYYDDDDGEDDD